MLPLSPGCGFREVCAEGFADAGPLGVAKHVDQIQVGRDKRLKRAVGRQGFHDATPVTKTFAGAWQADAPPMRAQDLGAEGDLVLIEEPFGTGRPQELAHLDGSRLATLLSLPAKPRASKPSRGGRKRASRSQAEHCRERRVELVGMNPSKHAEHVRDELRTSASGTSESGVVQTSEGPIPVLTRGSGGGSSAGSLGDFRECLLRSPRTQYSSAGLSETSGDASHRSVVSVSQVRSSCKLLLAKSLISIDAWNLVVIFCERYISS